ncbi:antitoxin [Nocardia sp. A7]|uniref:antitoxin n=1 Tax=Nocardia sp. A7 TaxID=2789274 RepID=UPI00397E8ABA
MSLVNTLKGLLGKGKVAAEQNADKINGAVDKAGTFIDGKTKGKYTDKIEKGKVAAKKIVPPQAGPGTTPGATPRTAPGTTNGTAPGNIPGTPRAAGPTPTDPGPKA